VTPSVPRHHVAAEQEYYILSLNGSQGAYCQVLLWWRPDNRGYTKFLEAAGRYKESVVRTGLGYYDNHETTIAIPCSEVERFALRAVDVDHKYEIMKLAEFALEER